MGFTRKDLPALAGWGLALVLLLGRQGAARSLAAWLWYIIAPFFWGGVLAFILDLPLTAVEHNLPPRLGRHRRRLALAISLLGLAAAMVLMCFLVIPQLAASIRVLSSALPALWRQASARLEAWRQNNHLPAFLSLPDPGALFRQLPGQLDGALTAAGDLAGSLVDLALGLVFACYLLLHKEAFYRQFSQLAAAWLPRPAAKRLLTAGRQIAASVRRFFAVQCLEAVILGGMLAAAMLLCRLPYAVLISVLVAVTAVIPVFGSLVGGGVGFLLVLSQDPLQSVWFLVVFLCVQQLEGNLVYPRVVGNSVGLPPIWVLASVTLGGRLFGVAGMLLMIPLCSVSYGLLCRATRRRLDDRQPPGTQKSGP